MCAIQLNHLKYRQSLSYDAGSFPLSTILCKLEKNHVYNRLFRVLELLLKLRLTAELRDVTYCHRPIWDHTDY